MKANRCKSGLPTVANDGVLDVNTRERLDNYLCYLKMVIGQDALTALSLGVNFVERKPGEILFQQGEAVENVWLLLKGSVVETRTRSSGPDGWERRPHPDIKSRRLSVLGLSDLVYRSSHSTGARAVEASQFLVVSAAHVTRLQYQFPTLNRRMLPRERISRLRSIPMLAGLDMVTICLLADVVRPRRWSAGRVIYDVGQDATTLYLIDRGQVKLERADGLVIWLGNGAELGFGEHSGTTFESTYPLDHSASAVCKTRLFAVPRSWFYAITGRSLEEDGWEQRRIRSEVVNQPWGIFAQWSHEDRAYLLGFMSHYHLPVSHLITQGQKQADSLWVLLRGKYALLHTLDSTGKTLSEAPIAGPSYLNEACLSAPYKVPSTVEAEPGSAWLRLHWQDYCAWLEQCGREDLGKQLRAAYRPSPVEGAKQRRRFAWLDPDEKVLLYKRRHWVALLAKSTGAIVLTVLVIGTWGIYELSGQSVAWLPGLTSILMFSTLLLWVWGIVDYLNDHLVVTNVRVVHQEKVVFVKNRRYIAPLEQIKDIKIKREFWGNVLDYANMEIQTPGTLGNLRFDRVPHPKKVRELIDRHRQERSRYYQVANRTEIYDVLAGQLGVGLRLPDRVWKPAQWASLSGRIRQSGAGQYRRAVPPVEQKPKASSSGDSLPTLVWRKHWAFVLRKVALQSLSMASCLALSLFFYFRAPIWASSGAVSFLFAVFFVAFLAWVIWLVWDWYLDTYELTDTSVKEIDGKPFGLDSSERSALLTDLVDIRVEQDNLFQLALNYGSVYLQTAATDGTFSFVSVPNPQSVGETIRQRRELRQQAIEKAKAIQRAKEFPEWMNIYRLLHPE